MKDWKKHFLILRREYNYNNSIIQSRYFKINDLYDFDINEEIKEENIYKEYLRVCIATSTLPYIDSNFPNIKLSQSDMLRINTNQSKPKNIDSKNQDEDIIDTSYKVLNKLKEKFPTLKFNIDTKYLTKTLEEKNLYQTPITKDSSYIQPDGGLMWVLINSEKKYILVSEQKRQGTNDKRFAEGKEEQAQGNAIERLGKNIDACDVLFKDEDIYPFVVFMQGCDFQEDSSIVDRAKTLFNFQTPNEIHLEWKQIGKHLWTGGSYFIRGHSIQEETGTSDWSTEEMFEIMYEIAEKSVNYYIKKLN